MFISVVGHSEGVDTRKTTRQAIAQCQAQLKGRNPIAGLVFASARSDHDLMLHEIDKAFPGLPLAGCSAGGEMSAIGGFRQDSICLTFFVGDTISMASGVCWWTSNDPEQNFLTKIQQTVARLDGKATLCLAFANNLNSCPVSIISMLNETLGPDCLVLGGYAATDMPKQDLIYQFCDTQVFTNAVSLLLFSGPVETAFCISNSWTPMGNRAVVEQSQGNYITRIGGKTAMQFYHDIFGPHPEPLLEMPLAVFDADGQYYIRVANEFNNENQGVRFDNQIPEGAVVQFTEATPQGILTDTTESLSKLVSGINWIPRAALIVGCVARRTILGLQADQEAVLIKEILPENTPFAGFYSYGEIAPLARNQPSQYHHCTMVALLIGEKGFDHPPENLFQLPDISTAEPDKDETIQLLERKLERIRQNQARLEYTKTLSNRMQKRMNTQLAKAKLKIEQQHSILKESLTLAQQIQQKLLPHIEPDFPGFEIAGKSIYCDQTGGDYYDYLVLPESKGRLSVVVGDVAGHGIASALLMTTARALLRMRASKKGTPAQIISDMNRFLSTDVQGSGQFMSLFYLVLDAVKSCMTWVRAGHDPALRYIPSRDAFEEMQGEGMVLGVLDDWRYQEYRTSMAEPGEIVSIGTDGIWETRDAKKEFYGKERLMEVIRQYHHKPAKEIVKACLDSVADFRMSLPAQDDITLVIIKAIGEKT